MKAYRTAAIKWSVMSILVLTGACASVGPPVEKIAKGEMAIANARQSNAITYAPLELKFAEDKLKMAKQAMKDEDYEKAHKLVDQALLDAKTAEAKSRSEKAKRSAKELRESIEEMGQELNRP